MAKSIINTHLGSYQELIESSLIKLNEDRILDRILDGDHTVWKPDPTEITNRLGWLNIIAEMKLALDRITSFTALLIEEGYTHALLLGMGGSSLAPDVFRKSFGAQPGFLNLNVLDSTHPDEVRKVAGELPPGKTFFIVSTKSGGTVETISFFKYFYNWVIETLGNEQAGKHFAAITDSGSSLETLARELQFREIFLNNPNIGGRYSALSYFGLVPAGLLGIDLPKLLERAEAMLQAGNLSASLGTVLGVLAKQGRDKLTFLFPQELDSLGDWIEQLIAESTGKEGVGILPVVGEAPGEPAVYGVDRVFIRMSLGVDDTQSPSITPFLGQGHPCVDIYLQDIYDLGAQFFLWELSTAITGYWLQINPFDQPNVESAKILARSMVAEYHATGSLPPGETAVLSAANLRDFMVSAKPGDYIAIQAYLPPSSEIHQDLQRLRHELRDRYKLATTLGFGPRFLHSTGQLHKGDAGNGLFIQFSSQPAEDLPIPDTAGRAYSGISFGTLILSQALGDRQALLDEGRRVLNFHLSQNPVQDFKAFLPTIMEVP